MYLVFNFQKYKSFYERTKVVEKIQTTFDWFNLLIEYLKMGDHLHLPGFAYIHLYLEVF